MTAHGNYDLLVSTRNIQEVLHFTTNQGLLGILASGEVLSRERLREDQYLRDVKLPNNAVRKDPEWLGFVNLSISKVNSRMLDYSVRQHKGEEGVWWAVLAFDPVILSHQGVWFTTTNNIYDVVDRGQGPSGLEALFAERVRWGHYGDIQTRNRYTDPSHTTCPQAEVLYPGALSLEALKVVYVDNDENSDAIEGWRSNFPLLPAFDIRCDPEVFR